MFQYCRLTAYLWALVSFILPKRVTGRRPSTTITGFVENLNGRMSDIEQEHGKQLLIHEDWTMSQQGFLLHDNLKL